VSAVAVVHPTRKAEIKNKLSVFIEIPPCLKSITAWNNFNLEYWCIMYCL